MWNAFHALFIGAILSSIGMHSACAEIVLDEFTEPAGIIEAPAMENLFVETLDIGLLGARRRIRIASSATDPVGSLDIDISISGVLSAHIDEIQRTSTGLPTSAVQFDYYFDPTDVTEGGKNDSIW